MEKYQVIYSIKNKNLTIIEKRVEFASFLEANSFAKQIRYVEPTVGKALIEVIN
jgi:hypothetical protein